MSDKIGVLHLGLPKTGTTTIQDVFYTSRQRLMREAGVLYPSLSANHTNSLCTMFMEAPENHIHNRTIGATRDSLSSTIKSYFKQYEDEIGNSDWRTLVFSAEGLSNLSRAELTSFFGWLKGFADHWKVFVWVRHPVAWVNSNAQELLKAGQTIRSMVMNVPLPNYKGKISNFLSVFGKDRLNLVCFEDATSSIGGIIGEFCRNVGLSPELAQRICQNPSPKNVSMSYEAAYLLDSLNVHRPRFVNGKMGPHRFIGDIQPFINIPGGRFTLGEAFEARVKRLAKDDVSWVNSTFNNTLYRDVTDSGSLDTEQVSLDSIVPAEDMAVKAEAILISDLLNERYFSDKLGEGVRAFESQDYLAAIEHLVEASRIFPGRGEPVYYLSTVYESMGDHTMAVTFAERAVKLSPRSAQYREWLRELNSAALSPRLS